MPKKMPHQVRLEDEDAALLERLETRTGLTKGEIIRRAVRAIARQVKADGISFLIEELGYSAFYEAKPVREAEEILPVAAEDPATYGKGGTPAKKGGTIFERARDKAEDLKRSGKEKIESAAEDFHRASERKGEGHQPAT